jgi:hypothetical protein
MKRANSNILKRNGVLKEYLQSFICKTKNIFEEMVLDGLDEEVSNFKDWDIKQSRQS